MSDYAHKHQEQNTQSAPLNVVDTDDISAKEIEAEMTVGPRRGRTLKNGALKRAYHWYSGD